MFYQYVYSKWKAGKVSVGLSADRSDDKVYLEGSGFVRFVFPLLSIEEKDKLARLSKTEAAEPRGYIYFEEFHPNVFRRTPIFTTRNIGNFEEAERRNILSNGGVIEPPRTLLITTEFDKELMERSWQTYYQELESKGIKLPDNADKQQPEL